MLILVMVRAGEASRVSALLFLVPPLAWVGTGVAAVGVLLATMRGRAT